MRRFAGPLMEHDKGSFVFSMGYLSENDVLYAFAVGRWIARDSRVRGRGVDSPLKLSRRGPAHMHSWVWGPRIACLCLQSSHRLRYWWTGPDEVSDIHSDQA